MGDGEFSRFLADVRSDFASALRAGSSPTARAALGVLTPLRRKDTTPLLLDALIDEAEREPDRCERYARLSYRHALGFEKIVLMDGAPQYMLRAHVWRPSDGGADSGPAEHVHNHRFAFASSVMRGELAMTVFGPDPSGTAMSRFREELSPGDEGWVLSGAGEDRLGVTSELHLTAGVDYFLSPDALHHILPAAHLETVTFCLETASVRQRTDVYAPLGAPVPARLPKRPLSPAAYKEALRTLRGLVVAG